MTITKHALAGIGAAVAILVLAAFTVPPGSTAAASSPGCGSYVILEGISEPDLDRIFRTYWIEDPSAPVEENFTSVDHGLEKGQRVIININNPRLIYVQLEDGIQAVNQ
jgi:hypothetical protein